MADTSPPPGAAPSDSPSLLAEMLSQVWPVPSGLRERLAGLEGDPYWLDEGGQTDPAAELLCVKEGWLTLRQPVPSGRVAMLSVRLRGDLAGSILSEGAVPDGPRLTALTRSAMVPVDKKGLAALMGEHPELGAVLFALAAQDKAALLEQFAANTHGSARVRIGVFLLQLGARLDRARQDDGAGAGAETGAGAAAGASHPMPMTQKDIGDACGLTNIHVSRTLRAMQEDGLVEWSRSRFAVTDRETLARECGYTERRGPLDLSWLSGAGPGGGQGGG